MAVERMPFALPSVTSDTVSLTRFTDWFRLYARVPLRYVIGQPGAGKTTAVGIWAQQQKVDNVAWISLRAGTDDAELVALLGEVIEDPRAPRPLTIVLDDIDRASASARSLLAELYLRAPENLQFIYVARAYNAVDVIEGEQRGVVAVAGGTQMRFGAEDIALFCEVMGVPFGHRDCAQLELATDGWAFAVTGAVRVAKAFGLSASDALERWRSTQARSVERIVAEALKVAPARDAQDLLDIVEGRAEAAPATLRRLAAGDCSSMHRRARSRSIPSSPAAEPRASMQLRLAARLCSTCSDVSASFTTASKSASCAAGMRKSCSIWRCSRKAVRRGPN
jgi:hypothetical protein